MIQLHKVKLLSILLFGSFFIMMKTMPHLFNKWMKILAENIVYRVDKMCPRQTKWGSRCILHLRNDMGQIIKVWAPTNVVRDLKTGFKLNGKDCLAFIKSLGQTETNVMGEPKRKFYDFETVYLPL